MPKYDKQRLKSEGLFYWDINGERTNNTDMDLNLTITAESSGIYRYVFGFINDLYERETEILYTCFIVVSTN